MIASQMPMVRHGWVALLRARRSVNPAAVFCAVLRDIVLPLGICCV